MNAPTLTFCEGGCFFGFLLLSGSAAFTVVGNLYTAFADLEVFLSDFEGEKSTRRYPRRRLRGPVPVVYSMRLRFPKLHMVEDCDGIERTPAEARLSKVYSSAKELGLDFSARPCRNCTLESVLLTTLRPDPAEDQVFVTATSQANPLDPGAKIYNYKWRESSESGKARLLRVAKKLQLSTVSTAVGPVLYGFVPSSGAAILMHNLRTLIRPDVRELPDGEVIECAWTLLGDNPPELGLDSETPDAWLTATALVG